MGVDAASIASNWVSQCRLSCRIYIAVSISYAVIGFCPNISRFFGSKSEDGPLEAPESLGAKSREFGGFPGCL